jgi:hypothetical protein
MDFQKIRFALRWPQVIAGVEVVKTFSTAKLSESLSSGVGNVSPDLIRKIIKDIVTISCTAVKTTIGQILTQRSTSGKRSNLPNMASIINGMSGLSPSRAEDAQFVEQPSQISAANSCSSITGMIAILYVGHAMIAVADFSAELAIRLSNASKQFLDGLKRHSHTSLAIGETW